MRAAGSAAARRRPVGAAQRRRCTAAGLEPAADPYSVLGLTRGASGVAVRRRYRELALRTHPDTSSAEDDGAEIRRVNAAYQAIAAAGGAERGGDEAAEGSAPHWGSARAAGVPDFMCAADLGGMGADDLECLLSRAASAPPPAPAEGLGALDGLRAGAVLVSRAETGPLRRAVALITWYCPRDGAEGLVLNRPLPDGGRTAREELRRQGREFAGRSWFGWGGPRARSRDGAAVTVVAPGESGRLSPVPAGAAVPDGALALLGCLGWGGLGLDGELRGQRWHLVPWHSAPAVAEVHPRHMWAAARRKAVAIAPDHRRAPY
eukprot:TRINITY_DN29569_c0_g1_i1.p1 TRINITY_DN29569_c0_g1~~TRINITY_DN29569_c0_g1_i1.p1  ORF type:complete len:344 (+),score=83.58 TRINITY_DN29569_c0_g1_i1:73-1032(+)